MDIVHETMMHFFSKPLGGLVGELRCGFNVDANAIAETAPSKVISRSGSEVHREKSKEGTDPMDDDIFFSRFDDLVSCCLVDDEDYETTRGVEEEDMRGLQVGTDWTTPPQPESLLFRQGWSLNGLSPFISIPSRDGGPAVCYAVDG